MVLLGGWDIDLKTLPGYTADAQLFEIANTTLAYVVYDLVEIRVNWMAGHVAVYQNRSTPSLMFNARVLALPDEYAVRCDPTETMLLVYDVSVRERMENYVFVNLTKQEFAPVFIPVPFYRYALRRVDDGHFLMTPAGEDDSSPYNRSYMIDALSLKWFPYEREEGFDILLVPESGLETATRYRPVIWRVLWYKIYMIALSITTPMRAQVLTDRVMQRVEHFKTDDPSVDLHALVVEENKRLSLRSPM